MGMARILKYCLNIVDKMNNIPIINSKYASYSINELYLDIVPYLNYNVSRPDFHDNFAYRIEQHNHNKPGYIF